MAQGESKIGKDGTVKIEIDTGPARLVHGNSDHKYTISAEVRDQSRRTIMGEGTVLVARNPFKVYTWVDRGHYRVGETVQAGFQAQTLDQKPVKGKGRLVLFRVTYENNRPKETAVQQWPLDTDDRGRARMQIQASRAGQYRLSFKLTDAKQHTMEGGYLFMVRGQGDDGADYRFAKIELVTDKREYAPGEKVRLLINTDRKDAAVVLFVRPANGVYLPPKVIHMTGKSTVERILVRKKDMPNFFVEALTVYDGTVHSDTREIIVPPEKRVLNVAVTPSKNAYLPGEKATMTFKLTDYFGNPFQGSAVISVYDRSVEYISGGSNVPEIRQFFWKWRRYHHTQGESSLSRRFYNLLKKGEVAMGTLGAFGHLVTQSAGAYGFTRSFEGKFDDTLAAAEPASPNMLSGLGAMANMGSIKMEKGIGVNKSRVAGAANIAIGQGAVANMGSPAAKAPSLVQPTIRTRFADTAYWAGTINTDAGGMAEVSFPMPENLTGWKAKVWAMGHGTKVGQGTTEVVTRKDLILRLQAPRFFVETDEVVLSANVHNYLKQETSAHVILELDGGCLGLLHEQPAEKIVTIPPGGEQRVDWRVLALKEGEAVVRMKALTGKASDAMQMRFPVLVHGMMQQVPKTGVIRPDKTRASVRFDVPGRRRVDQSRLELRYSPTLAGAMVDALPYLADYPYGCTEQTLNRFLPTVMTWQTLKRMGLDLATIRKKRTNLNAQEIGDDKDRAKQWKHHDRNPVFDEKTVSDMVRSGIDRLAGMQLSDGGWGWFSGYGEHAYPHTTAYVVHGLQMARQNEVPLKADMVERGIQWLQSYQDNQVRELNRWDRTKKEGKVRADNLDAFVYMVLVDENISKPSMGAYLYRDRNHLAVYAKAMFGMALHRLKEYPKRDMILQNIEQYLVQDAENQTAYLNLPNNNYWWYWYGSEYEAHAYYLKLLSRTDPSSEKASGLVKYLLNNRKHTTYWKSTRDTAVVVEAFADYMAASGEDKPDLMLEVFFDKKKMKTVHIDADNLFAHDNKWVLEGDAITTGRHTLELKKSGKGPVYFNAYLDTFSLEDFLHRQGLEIKIRRKVYALTPEDKTIKDVGSRGQVLDRRVEKFVRTELGNHAVVKSGRMVEVELVIESKNDYEYVVLEDMKAAGLEPVAVRSGYTGNEMGAYVEFRDQKVCFFVQRLARGKHSVSYRLRAETPGRFSALPTRAYAMYAPELKANSDEIKLIVGEE